MDSKNEPYILVFEEDKGFYCAKMHHIIQKQSKLETCDVATIRFHNDSIKDNTYYLDQITVRNKENLGCGLGKILMNFIWQTCKENNIPNITGSYEPHEPGDEKSTKEFYKRNGFSFIDKGTIMVMDEYFDKVPKHCIELRKIVDFDKDYISIEKFDGINIIENTFFDKHFETEVEKENREEVDELVC